MGVRISVAFIGSDHRAIASLARPMALADAISLAGFAAVQAGRSPVAASPACAGATLQGAGLE
jgi:hypothetical protein